MTIDQTFLLTGRSVRTQWRTEEESFISDAFHYAKHKMSLREYLASAAHAGHEINVTTSSHSTKGSLVHIGEDFFSLVPSQQPGFVKSYVLHGIEIEVLDQTPKARAQRLLRHGKSFRSLLDDISLQSAIAEIETRQGNSYSGMIELFADCISIAGHNRELVGSGKVIVPIDGIASILYSV